MTPRFRPNLERLDDRINPVALPTEVNALGDGPTNPNGPAITLRQAILNSQSSDNPGADIITFDRSIFDGGNNLSILLNSALPVITEPLTINGITFNLGGDKMNRPQIKRASVNDFRIFETMLPAGGLAAGFVHLSYLDISDGKSPNPNDPNGGGIKAVNTDLNLAECIVHDNAAIGDGGGVWVGGWKSKLTVSHEGVVLNNTAGANGGGIAGRNAHVKMEMSSSVIGNQAGLGGGGVYVISDNTYQAFGDDILFQTLGNEDTQPIKIAGNKALNGDGGGVLVACTLNVNGLVPGVDLNRVTIQDNKAFGTPPPPGGAWTSGRGGGIATKGTIKVDADENTLVKLNGQRAPAPVNPPALLGVFIEVAAPGSTFVANAVITNDNYQILGGVAPPPPGGE